MWQVKVLFPWTIRPGHSIFFSGGIAFSARIAVVIIILKVEAGG